MMQYLLRHLKALEYRHFFLAPGHQCGFHLPQIGVKNRQKTQSTSDTPWHKEPKKVRNRFGRRCKLIQIKAEGKRRNAKKAAAADALGIA